MPAVPSPKLDASIWRSASNPVAVSSLLPPPVPRARAWQRIPVPAVTRPYKIWKRTVAEPGTESDALQYALAMVELESQGQGARKRARKAAHVPVWGDARWDSRCEEPRDGSWDLVEARASVAAIQDEEEDMQRPRTSQRPAIFAEEKLRWVPRKRHNSRWPIEPTTPTQTTMVADLQPLVEFEIPTASIDTAAAQHSPRRATEKQMRRRSTRRLSTRLSFAHIEDVPVQLSPLARGESQVATTPARSSPTKMVSASSQNSFTLLATPAKALFRPSAAKDRSPASQQSPLKTARSPPTPVVEAPVVEDPSMLSESLALVFEQPLVEIRTEPAHETRRRVSLHNAMRLERSSLGGRRSLDSGHLQAAAQNRRHSSLPQLNAHSSDSKSRRHTLDVFGESNTGVTEMEQDEATTTGLWSAETTENISEVVVDVCANLDIFGQQSGVTRRHKARRAGAQQGPVHEDVHSTGGASSPQSATSHSSHEADDSSLLIGLGITLDGSFTDGVGGSAAQAAMLDTSFSMPAEDGDQADTPNGDFWLEDGIGSTPCGPSNEVKRGDEAQQDDMFAPHDPEGLSTIFEDDEASFAQSTPPQRAVDGAVDASRSTPSPANEDDISAEISSPPSITTADPGDHAAESPAPESSAGNSEQEERPKAIHGDKTKQSFDFTMDADEAQQRAPSTEPTAALVSELSESSSSPSSIASAREAVFEQDREQEQSGCSPSPRDDDDSDDLRGTIVVDDFMAHGEAASAQDVSDTARLDDLSECEDVGDATGSGALSQVEVASSPRADVEETEALSSTPPQGPMLDSDVQDAANDAETVLETPPAKDKGFTPINAGRVTPPIQQGPSVRDVDEEDLEDAEDLQEEDMALAMDYEPTVPINLDDDEPAAVEASHADAEPAAALQEDSETEMLRKFVTRVSANKAAAAAALARRSLGPKRRSGSTGSTTSITGSPAAKPSSSLSAESAQRMMAASMSSPPRARLPLRAKDANSPSPTKKRKASGGGGGGAKSHGKTHPDDLFSGNPALYSAEISPPKSKRLRSRRRAEHAAGANKQAAEQQSESQDNHNHPADPPSSGPAPPPRRSTRSRNARVQLKPPAPSANSIALSHIPVRLPGGGCSSGGMIVTHAADTSGDRDMPAPVVTPRAASARTTAEEKDLAAVTRVNTRKNKGGAVPPRILLGRQQQQAAAEETPLGYSKLKEVKGVVFDAKEGSRDGQHDGGEDAAEEEEEGARGGRDGAVGRKGKGVRWASELVRFNTDFEPGSPSLAAVPSGAPLVPARKGARVVAVVPPAEEEKAAEEVVPAAAAAAAAATAAREDEVAGGREPPRPDEKPESETKPAPPPRRTRQSRLQAPTPVSKKILAPDAAPAAATKAASASVVKMATRRTKIASLGMGVNGTPAPKRRTRA